jgi:hypothetical protein
MGDHLLRVVYSTFVSTPPPPALSIYDERRMSTSAIYLFRITGYKTGESGQSFPHPCLLYMGAGLIPLSLNMPAIPHQV